MMSPELQWAFVIVGIVSGILGLINLLVIFIDWLRNK